MLGATLEWAQDEAGEIGRIKPDPPNTARVSLELYELALFYAGKRK